MAEKNLLLCSHQEVEYVAKHVVFDAPQKFSLRGTDRSLIPSVINFIRWVQR